jgi:hypothetical protein
MAPELQPVAATGETDAPDFGPDIDIFEEELVELEVGMEAAI